MLQLRNEIDFNKHTRKLLTELVLRCRQNQQELILTDTLCVCDRVWVSVKSGMEPTDPGGIHFLIHHYFESRQASDQDLLHLFVLCV